MDQESHRRIWIGLFWGTIISAFIWTTFIISVIGWMDIIKDL